MKYDTWDEYYMATDREKPKTANRKIYWSTKEQCYKRKENKMANTFTIKRRNNAPNFVFGSFGCKYDDLKAFVNDRGYINFDILMGKDSDSYYVKVSDYGINQSVTKSDTDKQEIIQFDEMDEIPF